MVLLSVTLTRIERTKTFPLNNWNDLFIVGDFGLVSHYNGSSWKHYDMSLPNANFYSVSVKGNTVAAVGQDGNNAVITIGRRN